MVGLTHMSFLMVGLSKILLAWETLNILLLTGISKRNVFYRKKKKNVVVSSKIHDKFISSNLTYKHTKKSSLK